MQTLLLRSLWIALLVTFALLPARAQSSLGNALSFNGVNQYVSVANFGAIAPTNEVTVEFWANANALDLQSAFMLTPLQPTNQFDALISFNDGTTYWDCGNIVTSGRHTMPNPPGTVGNWTHYAMVASQSGNAMRVYTNGALVSSKVGMVPFVRGSYELGIGGLSGFFFNGRLNEFRIWNTARSQAQIQAARNGPLVGNEAGLLLYYKLDSSSGTVATNTATATGAAYHGTLRNGAQWVSSTPRSNVVTSVNDDGMGSLRRAVALTLPGGVITFATNLSGATITLTNGQLLVQNNLTIDASALADRVTISGNNASRVLMISNNATVVLKSLDISGGRVGYLESGAGLHNLTNCSLTLTNCKIQGNQAASVNGAICGGLYNAGTATLVRCQISNNGASGTSLGASGTGGGIYNVGTATLTECLISSNSALGALGLPSGPVTTGGTAAGAGIYNLGRLTLNRCTLQNNGTRGGDGRSTGDNPGGPALGGGLYNAGSATLNQNSIGQNTAVGGNGGNSESTRGGAGADGLGGGIYNTGPLTLHQNTISANSVSQGRGGSGPLLGADGLAQGGGIYNTATGTNCTPLNNLIAGNLAPGLAASATNSDAVGVFSSRGHNLVGATNGTTGFSASGDLKGTATAPLDPRLGSLQDRGGPTWTFAPQPGSPAIDAGDDSVTNSFATDQRGTGFARRVGAHVDIGAYEVEASSAPGITSVSAGGVTLDPQTQLGRVNVSASVNPNSSQVPATVWVEYGPYPSYGQATAPQIYPAGVNDVPVNQLLTGLAPGLAWHYRWVARNYYGTNASADQSVAVGPQLYTQGMAVGQSNVLNSPNTYGLYTSNQIQALNVDGPLLQKNPTNGLFKLTIGVQVAPNLTSSPSNFVDFPMNAPGSSTFINDQGKLEFYFSGSNAAFFRLQSQ